MTELTDIIQNKEYLKVEISLKIFDKTLGINEKMIAYNNCWLTFSDGYLFVSQKLKDGPKIDIFTLSKCIFAYSISISKINC